ncbi:MAG: class I SAM-dependent methyltransferase [Candidatus Aenigmarchaeota archaeon]|nr:class I SAM-dependent methyltransferase [Candidatus Aenigmarchaeota archaeon]
MNIGCAHGSDFIPFSHDKFRFFGIDSSRELVLLSKKYARKNDFVFQNCAGDMKALPYKSFSFDYIICIASLHHLLQRKERLQALEEMKRVAIKEIFITVWDIENPDLSNKKIIEREWRHGGKVLKRQYYLYDKDEFQRELEEAGFSAKVWSDKRNILALVKLK